MRVGSTMIRRRTALVGGLAALILAAGIGPAGAQADFPSRTLTFVVPFAAGSATDTLARVLGQRMAPAGEMFKSMAGIEMVHVPYKSNPPAITDLIGGQIGLVVADLATTLPHARDGKLKALAVTSAGRTALAPDLPTMAEAGVPGYELTAWFAAYAPAQTPKAAVQKLHAAFTAALAEPEVAKALRAAGIEPSPSTPEDLGTFTVAETEKWARLIKLAGIEPE